MLTQQLKMWNRLYCNITANQASAAAIQISGGITQYSYSEVRVRITKYSKVRVTKYRSDIKSITIEITAENSRKVVWYMSILYCIYLFLIDFYNWYSTVSTSVLARSKLSKNLHQYFSISYVDTECNIQIELWSSIYITTTLVLLYMLLLTIHACTVYSIESAVCSLSFNTLLYCICLDLVYYTVSFHLQAWTLSLWYMIVILRASFSKLHSLARAFHAVLQQWIVLCMLTMLYI